LGDVAAAGASGTDSCAIAAQGNIAASAIIARRIGITEELFMSYLLREESLARCDGRHTRMGTQPRKQFPADQLQTT
jgi:hypothetical protein